MTKNNARRGWGWLLPLGLALPFVGGVAWLAVKYGQMLIDLLGVALKVTVIR